MGIEKQFVERFGSIGEPIDMPDLNYTGKYAMPIELTPKSTWRKKRLEELCTAITRHFNRQKRIPAEWWKEYDELINEENEKT